MTEWSDPMILIAANTLVAIGWIVFVMVVLIGLIRIYSRGRRSDAGKG